MSKNLDRKELREDAFVNAVMGFLDSLKRRKSEVIRFAVIACIIIAFVGVVLYRKERANIAVAKAVQDMIRNFDTNDQERHQEMLALSEDIMSRYPSAKGVEKVLFHQGNYLYRLGQFAEAIHKYNGFILSYPRHPQLPLVKQSLAYCYEELGQLDRARDILVALISEPQTSYLLPQIYLDLARVSKLSGDSESARQYCQTVIDQFSETDFAKSAEIFLAFL